MPASVKWSPLNDSGHTHAANNDACCRESLSQNALQNVICMNHDAICHRSPR
jgi:hypothetical protein